MPQKAGGKRKLGRASRGLALGLALLAAAYGVSAVLAQGLAPVVVTSHGDNSPWQENKPYVILVSLDGFRYDYARRYGAQNILALARRGASAPEGMLPVYPSVTFPNHYSIVTGLYPENHGIVGNSFYDPALREHFVYTDRGTSANGNWYGGTPLWVLAEKQGMRAACFFWPGAEAEIDDVRPTYNVLFDPRIANQTRVDQALAWLHLPPEQRPHFITLYFGDADSAGHATGTDSPETAAAVRRLDSVVARLVASLALVHLPVDLFVVSDHGMVNTQGPWINLDEFANLSGFETSGALLYPPNDDAAERAYTQLKGASAKFDVYRRDEVPPHLHFSANARIGDPVVVPTGPYLIRAHGSKNPREVPPKGMHGYDPATMMKMRAIFYAVGPDIQPGAKVAPFENVDIYPLIARILGLEIGRIDGDGRVLEPILRTAIAPAPTAVGARP
jgi:predicted AlkP superfamily pyrophosphatase or phosphodiesterase